MSWVLTTSGAAIAKAGYNVNSFLTQTSGAATITTFSDQAESMIAVETGRDWVSLSGSTAVYALGMLSDAASSIIGKKMINYDPSGYTNLEEASLIIDVLTDDINRNISVLRDKKFQDRIITTN